MRRRTQAKPRSQRAARADERRRAGRGSPTPGRVGHAEERLDDRYRLVRPVGDGTMAEVWFGIDTHTGLPVAAKIAAATPGKRGDDADIEVRAAGLVCHPNVARLLDHGMTADGRRFVVLEWIEGIDLAVSMHGRALAWQIAVWIGCQVARALAHAHGHGVLHLDLRPENTRLEIMDGSVVRVRLLDFGAAAFIEDAPGLRMALGSVHVTSPEVAAGKVPGPHSDLYGLGCLLWWMLSGNPPFAGDPAQILAQHRFTPVPALGAEVPAAVADLLACLLAKQPEYRPQSAADVARILELAWRGTAANESIRIDRCPLGPLPPSTDLVPELAFAGAGVFGREALQAQLRELVGSAKTVQGGGILLCGGPGIGRSHMLRWLGATTAASGELRVVTDATCLTGDGAQAAAPRGLLARDAGDRRAAGLLCRAETAATWLTAEPTLWLLDDVQDLTADGHDVLEQVLKAVQRGRKPLVCVAAWRDAATATPAVLERLVAAGALHRVAMLPLAADSCQAWLKAARVDDALAEQWTALAAGHPRTLVALAQAHIRQGRVQTREGRWRAVAALPAPTEVKATLVQLLQDELTCLLRQAGPDRDAMRLLLHVAALADGSLAVAVAHRLAADLGFAPARIERALAIAVGSSAFVHGEGNTLSFRHTQLAQAASALFDDDARRTHRVLAQALRDLGKPAAAWAGHFWRAQVLPNAWQATQVAVEAALRVPDFAAVDRLLADAERYGEAVGAFSVGDWAWLLLHRAEALVHLARLDEARLRFDELRALDAVIGAGEVAATWTRQAWLGAAAVAEASGDYQACVRLCEDGLVRAGEGIALRAELHQLRGTAWRMLGQNQRAIDDLHLAVAQFETAADQAGRERARIELALIYVYMRDGESAAACLAARAGIDRGDRLLEARRSYANGLRLEVMGEYLAAIAELETALQQLRVMGHRRGEAGALAAQAIVWRRMGRFDEAERTLHRTLMIREQFDDHRGIMQSLNNLADLYVAAGRPADALEPARRSLRQARETGAVASGIYAMTTLADALRGVGEYEEAGAVAEESLCANGDPPAVPSCARACIRVLAAVAAARGDHAVAYQLLIGTIEGNRPERG